MMLIYQTAVLKEKGCALTHTHIYYAYYPQQYTLRIQLRVQTPDTSALRARVLL